MLHLFCSSQIPHHNRIENKTRYQFKAAILNRADFNYGVLPNGYTNGAIYKSGDGVVMNHDWKNFWQSYRNIEIRQEEDLLYQVGSTVGGKPISREMFMAKVYDIKKGLK